MKYLVMWITIFIIIYLFYLLFVILRKKKLELFKNNTGLRYMVKVYHLDLTHYNIKTLANLIAITNAFIIATTFIVVDFISNLYLKIILALITLVILQLLTYHIMGTILKRSDKNV